MWHRSAPNKLITVITSNYINIYNKKLFNETFFFFLYVTKQTRHILLLSTPTFKEWVKEENHIHNKDVYCPSPTAKVNYMSTKRCSVKI